MLDKQLEIPAWHVFYTSSRHEKKSAEVLSKNGFEVFLPIVTEMKQWSDRKKKVQTPLFKSYLFVFISHSQIQSVCGFPGVSFAIKNAGKYATIKPKEIEQIRLLLSSGIYAEAVPGNVVEGDSVIIDEGPLKGMAGQCVLIASQNFFFIEVPSINHLIRIKIHASAVRKV
jgi:transcription termination/antitermination protein NusG